MSTARHVPETNHLSGDNAWETLRTTGRLNLIRDAVIRLRAADGFSHSRSLAFATSLVMVQGVVVLVGISVAFGQTELNRTIFAAIESAVPGPTSGLLMNALTQARRVGLERPALPLLVGLVGTLVTASTATGQIIRGINRIYGIENDGPFIQKYARAFLLAVVVLLAMVGAGVALTAGGDLSGTAGRGGVHAWRFVRWPLALGMTTAAVAGLLRWAPRRRQPRWSWLMLGGVIAVGGWTLMTAAFAVVFRVSSTFGQVYGPLAGLVALQLWTFFSAVAVFFGVSVAAQLEAVRSGAGDRPRA
ncbi:MAG TPA: YihY/virulence factor BrkB family protein [Polyangia bacterium]|nr:YihY/virulence factor BrkB family protein [Polyangia bacterium]